MLPFAYYMLKVIVCSAILFGYYWFFLRNKIFHHYNRFYLLAVIALSLTLPLLKFNIWQSSDVKHAKVIQMLQVVSSGDEYMDEVIIYSRINHVNKEAVLMWLFISVCVVFATIFFRTILKINKLKRNNPVEEYHGIKLINTDDKSTPFSFFKNIFWNNNINITTDNGYRILKHELAHVEQKHSHDKIFVNIVLIFFWCNPVFWLLRKELNLIHEFTADKKAVEDGDTAAFAAMILQTTYPRHQFELTNNFFYSPLKRRLMMLTKNNKKVNYLSRLLVLPLTFTVVAAFTFKSKPAFAQQTIADKKITVVLDAGHGGNDKGAYSTSSNFFEKDLTLTLVKKIKALNSDASVNIVLLRETDVYQTPQEKAKLANALHPDLFISIHGDATSDKEEIEKSGAHVLVCRDKYANVEKSKVLASAIIGSLQTNFGLPVAANPMQREKGIWILQESICPAVLIEAAYMNNKKDVAYITSEAGQTAFAKRVLEAISNYAGNVVISRPGVNENNIAEVNTPQNGTSNSEKNVGYKKPVFDLGKDSVVDASEYAVTLQDQNKTRHGVSIRGEQKGLIPIYVLNGSIISENEMQNIDPNTIDNIHVLKGNDAVRKYGVSSKNAVVEIVTKNKNNVDTPLPANDLQRKNKEDKVFTKLEQEASFPGGKEAWQKYLRTNLDASMPVNEGWPTGKFIVLAKFIVEKDGTVKNVETENYKGTKTSKMCIEFIKNGPKWIPGKQNGRTVSSYRLQPITFVISED